MQGNFSVQSLWRSVHVCTPKHGPINSWDRLPFLTDVSGTGSFESVKTHVEIVLIFANYGGSQGFDTDDGSSFYAIHDNVMYAADGMKMDYGGEQSTRGFILYSLAEGQFAYTGHDSDFYGNLVVTNPCKCRP